MELTQEQIETILSELAKKENGYSFKNYTFLCNN